jgi:DNA-binding CsgD family transcriptional regulator
VSTVAAPALSDRQMRVLRLRAEGLSGPQIAAALHLAVSTVAYHERVLVHVLRARNLTHAVHLAHCAHLLHPERHGDHAGYAAHLRRGEDPQECESCAAGERTYRNDLAAKRRAATEPKDPA